MRDALHALLAAAPRLLTLEFPDNDGPNAVLLPEAMVAKEAISRDFEFTITLLSDDASIALKDVQCKMVCIKLKREDGSERYFNGHCFKFTLQTIQNGLAIYRMVLRPWLAFYDLNRDNFIFHNKNIEDQTRDIFHKTGLSRHEFQTRGKDPLRTFSVQYGESDYNYLHRRWEEMGWVYWYHHTKKGHKLILCDNSARAEPIDGKGVLTYHHDGGSNKQDKIAIWSPEREVVADKVGLSGFDFKKPSPVQVAKSGELEQGKIGRFEDYEYLGLYGFKDQAHAMDMVARRIEQLEAEGKRFKAKGNCRQAQAGRWFKLDADSDLFGNHADSSSDEYLILKVKHTIANNYLSDSGQQASYRNKFTCLRRKIPWRPKIGFNSQPAPVPGIDTATVVGRVGEEIYTDKYARIKVKFHWDRKAKDDETASCWVRVQTPWANKNFGMISIPRIGTEVVIQYLQDDPDHPVVTGQFYNERHMPPWDLPANQTQSGILTRSSKGGTPDNANALRFEDKMGEEEVWLHAEKDQRIEVEHDESHWVGHDRKKTIDHDETTLVKHDRTETVDHDETITVHNNRKERVDHNEKISIGDNRHEDVGKNEDIHIGHSRSVHIGDHKSETIGKTKAETVALAKFLTVGGLYQTSVGGAMNSTVAMAQMEEVGMSKTTVVGKTVSTTAGEQFKIVVGKSSFIMHADGRIEIDGTEILINGNKKIELHGKDIDNNPG
jgi:type VI secretion system secreted protein VgrG